MKGQARMNPANDDGFTLIELLVVILILGVIAIPLSNVVIAYLRNTDATNARLLESHDIQIASAYWAQDVATIGVRLTDSPYTLKKSVETSVAYSSSVFKCGTDWTTPATTPAVTLAGDHSNGPAASTLDRVAYIVRTDSGETQLHRLRCNGSATAVSDVTVAHNLDPSTPPTVACWGTAGTTDCTAAPGVPQTITLTLRLKNAGNRGDPYVVHLTGQRRQSL